MDKYVKRVRVYYFDKDSPAIPTPNNLITELFCNEQGQEVREERCNEQLIHFYDHDNGVLVYTTHDFPDGKRVVTRYTYDEDSNLVHCHWEDQPDGAYSDEWYEWSNKGKTCTRTKEIRHNDGTVDHELLREEYDGKGRLSRAHHFNDDFKYECIEILNYHYPDGDLALKEKQQSFVTKEGKQRKTWSREEYTKERVISEEIYGVDEYGKVFNRCLIYEYEEDEQGNWVVSRQISKGQLHCTVIREIEYW